MQYDPADPVFTLGDYLAKARQRKSGRRAPIVVSESMQSGRAVTMVAGRDHEGAGAFWVSCTITVDGRVLAHDVSRGEFASVSCSGMVP